MITGETGLPGAGKTLYCVDKLLRPLVGSSVEYETQDGSKAKAPRTIYTNINGLLLEHEKINAGAPWTYDTRTDTWTQPADGDKHGLNNWHEWAKPGAVIVFDEIQKPWPLASSGSRVPPCITALETHRHMGVDFIVLTQHPMLIHANLVRLIGRHLHVRRMGNMGLAIVYEWDSCSRTLLYKNAFTKSAYRYDKKVFELYKSAELHTKQPRKIPALIWGVMFGLGALAWFGPAAYGRISERINPSPVVLDVPGQKQAPSALGSLPAAQPAMVTTTVENPVPPPSPEVAGCASVKGVCRCYDKDAIHIPKPEAFCTARLTPAVASLGVKPTISSPEPRPTDFTASDAAVLAWMNRKPPF